MKPSPFIMIIMAGGLIGAGPTLADTFHMKDGSKLEGKILKTDDLNYLLEIQVSKGIKDERKVAKSEVLKIEAEEPDDPAFEALRKLTPTPDFLNSDDYAQRIRSVNKFLQTYPRSSHAKAAKEMLSELKSEANEILAGGIKFNGKLIPAAEYRSNIYEWDARITESKIRRAITAMQYLQGLRMFRQFESDFRNTTSYRALLPAIIQLIQTYQTEVTELAGSCESRQQERVRGLERMSGNDRRNTEIAIRDEASALDAQYKREKESKLGWLTIHPYFKPAMDDTLAFAAAELTRLNAATSKPAGVDGGKAFRDALAVIQSKTASPAAIKTAMATAKSAMVPARYLTMLEGAQ